MDGNFSEYEEVHLGAALWNRGNVMLGIYGQWHGHFSGDRRLVVMDLGLALTHDAVHYYEPIKDFRFIPAREQPESPVPLGPLWSKAKAWKTSATKPCIGILFGGVLRAVG